MAQIAVAAGVSFRPHFKTHPSAQIGEWFREQGVKAITVSSVEMAEYFAAAGWEDILIAFTLNIRQLERIRALAQQIHLEVLVEDSNAVQAPQAIAPTRVDVWIKVDAGAHRTGLDWHEPDRIRALAAEIQNGGLLCVIPAHSCLTVQALRNYLTLEGEVIRTMNS
jgi:D-serine deaminase-like pyridoxal phosphate-dependent protein